MAALIRDAVPSDAATEVVVRALALPGVSPAGLGAAAREKGGVAHAAREMVATRAPRLAAPARDRWEGWVAACLRTIRESDVRVLIRGESDYPRALMDLDAPPPALFARGNLDLLGRRRVGVVGTRNSTPDGRRLARGFAGDLAAAGVVVVSGLARGIDAAAHAGAGPARTIAVLGCGVDVLYPKSNARLQVAIGRQGLLLSERLPGTPAAPWQFPERNRIIAALSEALVMIQAPAKSGALITGDRAKALGRDVYAVPGPVDVPHYRGSNQRVRDDLAGLVMSAADVLERIGVPVPPDLGDRPPPELDGVSLALWRAVGDGAVHADDLASAVGLSAGEGLASLLALELRGHIRQLPGLRFARRRGAGRIGIAAGG